MRTRAKSQEPGANISHSVPNLSLSKSGTPWWTRNRTASKECESVKC